MTTVKKALKHLEEIKIKKGKAFFEPILDLDDAYLLHIDDMKEALEVAKLCLSSLESFEQMLRAKIAEEVVDKLEDIEGCENVKQSVEHLILGRSEPTTSKCGECNKISCKSNPEYVGLAQMTSLTDEEKATRRKALDNISEKMIPFSTLEKLREKFLQASFAYPDGYGNLACNPTNTKMTILEIMDEVIEELTRTSHVMELYKESEDGE